MFKLIGTVKVLNDTVQVSEKFSKREFVVTDTTSMYPQDISFQATQDKCSMLDAVQVNDQVEVSFNLRGREWTSPQGEVKYFNSLEAWRIEKVGQSMPQGIPQGGPSAMNLDPMATATAAAVNTTSEDDDLPF
jgi:hypothetical protein